MNWHDIFDYDGCNLYRRDSGKKAGTKAGPRGYIQCRVGGGLPKVYAHRIIWEMHNDKIPNSMVVDHINHIYDDNRIENLRLVTVKENSSNIKRSKRNTSGIQGVRRRSDNGNWYADLRVDGKLRQMPMRHCFEDAAADRIYLEVYHGFHPNHGAIVNE
ncbi:HNH endonuclease [Escherichia phage Rtp]|uniref:HNH-endonuclease n=1 Tax=Escherichia phage Rtp TaxID=2994041 RepID=Q333G4_9CAUD|nr:HNH endonuclease [Escherichia phage Rtp]CAJ42224.1 putative HNH-endonuclease [Escherichia phage Rtp]